jgi:DNA-directed RNA polymerase specialized sigma24 family protein
LHESHRRVEAGEAGWILAEIRKLPEADREPLMLRLVEGMTGPEIAERTGLKADSVRVNLCRGTLRYHSGKHIISPSGTNSALLRQKTLRVRG